VDGIYELIGLIAKILVLGFFTFVFIQVLRGLKKRSLLGEISKLEAKLASYRINLKNRVKKKAKRFRSTYPQSIISGDSMDTHLNKLTLLNFERNSDFQEYIELCKKINYYISVAGADKKTIDAAESKQIDFMGTDFKNEISIVRLINDMVSISKTLHTLLARYRHFERGIKIKLMEPINFPSLFELQKIFNVEISTSDSDSDQNEQVVTHKRIA
jgi:hypothetical protein